MRVIKFRGWNGKEIIQDVFNVKVNPESEHQGISIQKQCVFSWSMSSIQDVMQFTGLLDKNGVEIFEGDIIECWGLNLVVVWNESDASFFADSEDGRVYESGQEWSGNCVVIGNIHETPELLK